MTWMGSTPTWRVPAPCCGRVPRRPLPPCSRSWRSPRPPVDPRRGCYHRPENGPKEGTLMKTASARAIALVGVWAAAGCAGPGKATKVDPAKAFLAVSIGPRQATWTRNFNPLLPSALFPAAGGIYEPLLVYNRVRAAYVPWLATSYAWSADNTKLAFAIRAGVQWSDGQPFTARDVAFTFDARRRHPPLDSRRVWDFLSDVKATSDAIVVMTFRRAYTPGLVLVGHQAIVPEHIFKDVDVTAFADRKS